MNERAFGRGPSSEMKLTPYWWDDAPAPPMVPPELPKDVDVAIVGAGYTGLNAALVTAAAGRDTAVLDAEHAGWGCSTRNGGQISTSIKPTLEELGRLHGPERARAVHREGRTALEWIEALIREQGIDCDFERAGRFHAAHTPAAYEALALRERAERAAGDEAHLVPRAEQRGELGTDSYHGGIVLPRHAALHPAKFHNGLVARAAAAGARIVPHCTVFSIERSVRRSAGHSGGRFKLTTTLGSLTARDVVVATNGYSGALLPWLRRRIIPIGSYVIATAPLPAETVQRLFPTGRIASDTCRVVYYYRASPDRRRVIFGGRVSAAETDPRISAPRLRAAMVRLFPELADAAISHSWMGTVAYSFDTLAHCGQHDGIHYAAGYCGSGVSMASYLGMRTGQKVLGLAEGRTGFDGLAFPTRPLYAGRPWFLPAVVAWYRLRDERDWARGARAASTA